MQQISKMDHIIISVTDHDVQTHPIDEHVPFFVYMILYACYHIPCDFMPHPLGAQPLSLILLWNHRRRSVEDPPNAVMELLTDHLIHPLCRLVDLEVDLRHRGILRPDVLQRFAGACQHLSHLQRLLVATSLFHFGDWLPSLLHFAFWGGKLDTFGLVGEPPAGVGLPEMFLRLIEGRSQSCLRHLFLSLRLTSARCIAAVLQFLSTLSLERCWLMFDDVPLQEPLSCSFEYRCCTLCYVALSVCRTGLQTSSLCHVLDCLGKTGAFDTVRVLHIMATDNQLNDDLWEELGYNHHHNKKKLGGVNNFRKWSVLKECTITASNNPCQYPTSQNMLPSFVSVFI